ncbi:MAG: VCBS repeat-containing protein [Geminicoccaceae bacterium]
MPFRPRRPSPLLGPYRPCFASGLQLVCLAAGIALGLPGFAAADVVASKSQIDPSAPPQLQAKGSGDLDGDGKPDLVVGSKAGGIYWYRNGSWTPKRTISSGLKPAEEIRVADLTGDGKPDVLVAAASGGTEWFENGGGGNSWTQRRIPSDKFHDIAVADIDGDGKADVIGRPLYTNRASKVLSIWRQVSKTSFVLTKINLPEFGSGLAVAKIDGDAKLDIAVGKYWLKNQSTPGAIKFRTYTYFSSAEQDARVAAGDINGDGRIDLFVTPPHGTIAGSHKVAWYEAPKDRTATWDEHVLETGAAPNTHTALILDVDNDGRKDLVTAVDSVEPGQRPIKIFINKGNETFTVQTIANDPQHSMQALTVAGGKKALAGADYNEQPKSSIDLWTLTPAP